MFKRILAMVVSLLLIAAPCWSAIEVQDDGTVVGLANSINFTGSSVSLSNSVAAVTLNDMNSGTIDGAIIGGDTAAAGTFTTLTANTSITLGGVAITGWAGIVDSWTAGASTTTLNAAPLLFIATHSSGDFFATGFTAGTGDITLENSQVIDGGSNNAIKFIENDDTLTLTFTGDDMSFDSSDGGIIFAFTDATDGSFDIQANDDQDDYISFTTVAHVPTIVTFGTSNLVIAPDGGGTSITGTLDVSGALTVGSFTLTTFTMGDDTLSRSSDDVLRWTSNDEIATIEVYGFGSKDAILLLTANASGSNGDEWEFKSNQSGNDLTISNDTSGSQVAKLTMTTTGNLTMAGDILTFGDAESISNAVDGTILVSTND